MMKSLKLILNSLLLVAIAISIGKFAWGTVSDNDANSDVVTGLDQINEFLPDSIECSHGVLANRDVDFVKASGRSLPGSPVLSIWASEQPQTSKQMVRYMCEQLRRAKKNKTEPVILIGKWVTRISPNLRTDFFWVYKIKSDKTLPVRLEKSN